MVSETQLYNEEQIKRNWLYQPLMVKINELWIKNGCPKRYTTYPDYSSTFLRWNKENIGTWRDEKGREYDRLLIATHFNGLLEDMLRQIGKERRRGFPASTKNPNDDWDRFLAKAEKLIERYHDAEINLNDKTKERERRDLLRTSMRGEIPYQENIVFQIRVDPQEFHIALREVFFPGDDVSKSTEIKVIGNSLNLDNGRLNKTLVKGIWHIMGLPRGKIIISAQRYTEVLKGIERFENRPNFSIGVKIIKNSKNKLYMILFDEGNDQTRSNNDHKTVQISHDIFTEVKDICRRVVKYIFSAIFVIPSSFRRCVELSFFIFFIDEICEFWRWGWGVNITGYAGIFILGYTFLGEFVLKLSKWLSSFFSS